jgi:hypothetical protein
MPPIKMLKLVYTTFLLAASCTAAGQITLYKDKDVIDLPTFTNSIEDFHWEFKSENIFDTLVFQGKHLEEVKSLITNLDRLPNCERRMGTPRYAFTLEFSRRRDTLYFYDFNDDNNYENTAYFVNGGVTVRDTDDKLRNYLMSHFGDFIRSEYYYMPCSDEEYYYLKDE